MNALTLHTRLDYSNGCMEVVLRSGCAIKPDTETVMNIESLLGQQKGFSTFEQKAIASYLIIAHIIHGQTRIAMFEIDQLHLL